MNHPTPLFVVAWLGVGVVSVVLSALYSGMETGIYCLNKIRLRLRSEKEGGSARVLQKLLSDRTRVLIVLLVCNNLANYGTAAAAAVLLVGAGIAEGRAELAVTLLITPLLFVCGEMVPKTLFHRHADTLVYAWTWLLRSSATVLTYSGMVSLIKLIAKVTLGVVRSQEDSSDLLSSRQQIRGMLIETAHGGPLTGQQSEIAENVFSLHEVRLQDVMVPVHAVEKLEEGTSREGFLEKARRTPRSRLPVHRHTATRQIIGVVTVLDGLLLGPENWSLEKITADAPKLPPSMGVHAALTRLQRARQPMGVVTDRSGSCLGIVTIKDLVEEIVGELQAW